MNDFEKKIHEETETLADVVRKKTNIIKEGEKKKQETSTANEDKNDNIENVIKMAKWRVGTQSLTF